MIGCNKSHARFLLLTFSFLLPAITSANSDYSRLVVFGDSLSDPGNAFVITGMTLTPPYTTLVPDYPYARGGLHLSNGSTWIEQLAPRMSLTQSVGPAQRAPRGFTNYATDRTRACPDSLLPSHINLSEQVSMFLDEHEPAPDDALYVLFAGSNDVRDALVAEDPALIECALMYIAINLDALISAGARDFLVANVPNLGLIPAVALLGPVAQQQATFASASFNAGLEGILSGIEAATQGQVTFYRLDTFSLITDAPANYPDLNVTDPCINIFTGRVCAPASGYLFWDGIHPTVTGHALIAEEAASVLGLQ